MKKTNCLLTLSVAALCAAGRAYAVGTAPAVLSNYGEIQSVKNYSSNPFWNKNSPYNQNLPKPIYATGADLNTGDCNRVVENLVTAYCAEHNYCRNLRISDVRPTIMVQLSQLPGHNFATSCGGYIDSTFDKFQKEYGNTSTVNLPNTATQNTNIQITNPFTPKQTAEQRAVADRTTELERLQSITTPAAGVHAEYFPKTTADLSFTDRLANTVAGLEPYKDKESYKKPNFLGEDDAFFERLKNQNFEEYCNRRPNDPDCVKLYCEQHPDDEKCKKTTPAQQTDPNQVVIPPTGCPEIADHRDPKTCQCYKSDFMDSADCKCRGESKWDASKKKCVCPITDTSNLSINEWGYTTTMCDCRYNQIHNKYNPAKGMCEEGGATPPTASGPQCLIDVANNTNFKAAMTAKLAGVTDLNKWINNNKTSFYSLVADYVVQHCLKGTSDKITEFNQFLDTAAPLEISINFSSTPKVVSFDAEELFDYAAYWTYPIVINNSGLKNIGDTLEKSSTELPHTTLDCSGRFWTSKRWYPKNPGSPSALTKAASSVYPKPIGNAFELGSVEFPGYLYNANKNWSTKPLLVRTKNYALARKQITIFVSGIKSDSDCSGKNMVVYLVSEPNPNENKPETVKIMSEPFIIR